MTCLLVGTFPEEVPGSNMLNNTCQIYNPAGKMIGMFRKVTTIAAYKT